MAITRAEYRNAKRAHQTEREWLRFETFADSVFRSLEELEEACLKVAVRCSMRSDTFEEWEHDVRSLIERRASAFLSTAKRYLDAAPQCLKRIGASDDAIKFRSFTAAQYDREVAYRLLDSLRNHAQHGGVSVTSLVRNGSVEFLHDERSGPDDDRNVACVRPQIDTGELFGRDMIKPRVRRELDGLLDKDRQIDLLMYFRRYASCIGQIHSASRELVDAPARRRSDDLSALAKRFQETTGESVSVSYCFAVDKDGLAGDAFILHRGRRNILDRLIRRNQHLTRIEKRIVSNELPRHLRPPPPGCR